MSIAIHHTAYDPADHRPAPRRYAWSVFAILFALMVVDYVDRQVVVSMFPHLKAQWDLSDSQLGALVSIVSITVALGAVPLSLLADRWSRVKSIFLMAIIWSLATICARSPASYAQLLAPAASSASAKQRMAPSAWRCWRVCFRRGCGAPCSARSSPPECSGPFWA